MHQDGRARRLGVMTNQETREPATAPSSARGRGAGWKQWQIAVIVLLIVGVVPVLANAVYVGSGWIGEGGEYLEDLPGLFVLTLVEAVPFLVLGACVIRTKRRIGFISVSIASLIVVTTSAYGYWVVFFPGEDSSSTDALIFILIIPVQWVAAIAGVTVSALGNRRQLTRAAA
jgi:hypothetical protein